MGMMSVNLFLSVGWPILAHGGGPHVPKDLWQFWSLDPLVVGGLATMILLYALGWRVMARRMERISPTLKRRAWLFASGMGTLILALVSPIDGLAEELFSVHMVQHNLLMLVAAALLVLSYPLPAMLLSLPVGLRRAIGSGWHRSGWLRGLWRVISQPLVTWLLQAGLLWIWHAPGLYQAAIANEAVHALEHISFLGSALLFWWVTIRVLGGQQERRGLAILYLFTAALQGGLLGALITFSPRVWYPIYAERGIEWGLSALADQQLAGTIMWVPAGLVYLLAALLVMKRWLDAMETEAGSSEEGRKVGNGSGGIQKDIGRKVDHESYESRYP
jgi:putative membrane protein